MTDPTMATVCDQIRYVDLLGEMLVELQVRYDTLGHHSAVQSYVTALAAVNKQLAGYGLNFGGERLETKRCAAPVWVHRVAGQTDELRYWKPSSARRYVAYRNRMAPICIQWLVNSPTSRELTEQRFHFTRNGFWQEQAVDMMALPDRSTRPTPRPASATTSSGTVFVIDEAMITTDRIAEVGRRLREDSERYGRAQAENLAHMRSMAPPSMRVINSWGGWGHAMTPTLWPEAPTHEVREESPKVAQPSVEATKTTRRLKF